MARLRIKKPGIMKNVQDCTDQELIYSSDWNNWKVFLDSSVNGTVNLSVPLGTSGSVVISHNLGYVPACEIWVNDGTNNFVSPGNSVTGGYQFDQIIDSSKITVYGNDGSSFGAKVFIVKYKIYYERILG
jgi:hypothetical protein